MECLDENAVLDLLEGRFAPEDRILADEHLGACEECRSLLGEIDASTGGSRRDPSSVWVEAFQPERVAGSAGPLPAAGMRVAGRYLLSHPIGAGGMGVVWAAERDDGEQVALKFLKSEGSDRARRFLREARIAASLSHPNIVTVHEILGAGGDAAPVIVMERLIGESLASRLRRSGALGVREAAEILVPVVDALSAAHAAGVVHRDVKPENIFLVAGVTGGAESGRSPSGRDVGSTVKVLDFGIAKRTRTEDGASATPDLTRTGAVMGTPYYMAPEQMFGEKNIDARADVWALGVVLYECLAGRRPIGGDNFGQVLKSATMGSIPPLASVAPSVPVELGDLTARMLSREPQDRPSLRDVSQTLARCASGVGPSTPVALPYAATVEETRTLASDHGATPSAVARSVPTTSPRSGRGRLAVLGAAMLLASGLAAWGLSRSDASARPSSSAGNPEVAAATESPTPPEAVSAGPGDAEGRAPDVPPGVAGPDPVAPLPTVAPAAARPARAGAPSAQASAAHPRPAPSAASPSPNVAPPRNKLAGGVEKQSPY